MSVNLLLCEGGLQSPDVRVLGKVLAGLCQIKPMGGKYGMGTKILAQREILGNSSVAGMLDGDFLSEWVDPVGRPRVWQSKDNTIVFGCRWERKEIENYLLDRNVINKIFDWDNEMLESFFSAMEQARDRIATYQAARIALSAKRIRFKELPSSFGREWGNQKYQFPDQLDEKSCEDGIRQTVANHQTNHFVQEAGVLSAFQQYLIECCPAGIRYQHYLYGFSGKDLFWAMDGWFKENGFFGAWAFREKVVNKICATTKDVADWVPEWRELIRLVRGTPA